MTLKIVQLPFTLDILSEKDPFSVLVPVISSKREQFKSVDELSVESDNVK
jgi:hypothetical protein